MACVALIGAGWLLQLDYDRKISTDVLDLLPGGRDEPELALVRQLASQAEARTMLMVLTQADGTPAPQAAAVRFATALAREPEFAQAVALGDTSARDAMGRKLFEQRLQLLFPRWLAVQQREFAATGEPASELARWIARASVQKLDAFLSTLEAQVFQDLVPNDPLLLLPGAVDRLKNGLSLVQPATNSTDAPALVWAEMVASPLSEAGQAPVFAAIAKVEVAMQVEFSGLQVAYTGVNRFAAASRDRIEKEVKWLNAASLIAVLGVALLFIKKVYRGLHLVPVVLLSTLGAWVSVTLVFERVHILVFVLGSLLAGVAIDYGFYLYMQAPERAGEDYWEKVRRLAKPLLASCLTTVAGFALLVWSELPLIRQLGVFVGAGLVCALVMAVVYFSTVKNSFLETRSFQGGRALSTGARRKMRLALGIAWLFALPGIAMLHWRDDIRALEIPSAELKRADAAIRAQFGQQEEQTVYLTQGDSLAHARESVLALGEWLRREDPEREAFTLAAIIPTPAEYESAVTFVREQKNFPAQFHTALREAGYEVDAFAGFFEAYAQFAGTAQFEGLEKTARNFVDALSGPAGMLVHIGGTGELSWFVTLAKGGVAKVPPPETNSVSVNQLESLNGVFARYRQSALWLSLVGLAIVGVGVFLTYGLRDGVRIFAIPLGACLGVFGLFGWLGQPLNLFHLLGAFLGVCLTHNYSIFSATSAYRAEGPPVSVRMSALTTAASFGVLAMSAIPVVRALGLTVSLMVIGALLLIEFEHLAKLGKK